MGIMHISAKVYSQIVNNISDVWYPPHIESGMLYYMEGQPLMVRCLKALVSFMWQMGGAYDSIFMPLRGLAVPFSTEVDSQIAHKRPDFG